MLVVTLMPEKLSLILAAKKMCIFGINLQWFVNIFAFSALKFSGLHVLAFSSVSKAVSTGSARRATWYKNQAV